MPIRFTKNNTLAICSLALLWSCHSSNPVVTKQDQPYQLQAQDHPLAGKIWDVENETYMEKSQLLEKVFEHRYVLLGETHDNMQHHEDHGWIIQQVAQKQPNTAVAFEMVTKEQAKVINNTQLASTDELLDILEKAKTGWEYKKYYRPVFDSVFNAKLKIYSADLDRETMMKTVSKGVEHAPTEVQQTLEKTTLSEASRASLKKEIEGTHCGMINDEMTKAMMLGQQVRDANIAHTLSTMSNDGADAIVLVSGSGHSRVDRGAPLYLKNLDEKATIISIAWLEVSEEANDPREYAKPWGQEKLPFNYVVFTPYADRPDPCEEMKKFMEHKHKKSKGEKTAE